MKIFLPLTIFSNFSHLRNTLLVHSAHSYQLQLPFVVFIHSVFYRLLGHFIENSLGL